MCWRQDIHKIYGICEYDPVSDRRRIRMSRLCARQRGSELPPRPGSFILQPPRHAGCVAVEAAFVMPPAVISLIAPLRIHANTTLSQCTRTRRVQAGQRFSVRTTRSVACLYRDGNNTAASRHFRDQAGAVTRLARPILAYPSPGRNNKNHVAC